MRQELYPTLVLSREMPQCTADNKVSGVGVVMVDISELTVYVIGIGQLLKT